MANIQIPDTCEFTISTDKIKVETHTNGDCVTLYPEFTAEQAATFAYLLNNESSISIEIKAQT